MAREHDPPPSSRGTEYPGSAQESVAGRGGAMEQRRKNQTRVLGPYRHPKGWRVVVITEEGGRSDRLCATEDEAHQLIRDVEKSLELEGPITVNQALARYEEWQSTTGKRPGSIRTTLERLRSLHLAAEL